MTFIAKFENRTGFLAISADSPGLAYAGRAAIVDWPDLRTTRYRVSCLYEPLPFVELALDMVFQVAEVRAVNAGVWDIFVRATTAGTRNDNTPVRISPVVHVFAPLAGEGKTKGWRFQLFDAGGSRRRVFDANEQMLVPKQMLDYEAVVPPVGFFGNHQASMKAYARAAICAFGSGSGAQRESFGSGARSSMDKSYVAAFLKIDNTTLQRTQICEFAERVDLPAAALRMSYGFESVLIIDMSDYK